MPTTKIVQRRFTPALSNFTPFGAPLFRDFDEMQNRMRRLFQQPLAGFGSELAPDIAEPLGWTPVVEVTESEEEFIVTAELPGMAPDDVTVEFENGVLTLKGEKTVERVEEPEKQKMHLWERAYGAFQRAFTFPAAVLPEKITAKTENGLLKIVLPKAPEAKPNVRKIAISNKK